MPYNKYIDAGGTINAYFFKFYISIFAYFSGLNAFAKDEASEIPLTFSGYVHTATTYNLGDNEDESNNYHTFSDDDFTMTPSAPNWCF